MQRPAGVGASSGRCRAARRRRPRASSRTGRARRRGASRRGARTGRRRRARRRRERGGARRARPARRSSGGSTGSRRPIRPVSISPARTSSRASSERRKPTFVARPRIAVLGQRAVQAGERGRAVRAVGDHLGDHRVVVGADHRAGLDRGVDAHAVRVARPAAPGRRTGRSCASSALMRASIAWPRHARPRTSSASPAATRSCSSTRSRPVTSSVTGCSTCSRAFISRKKCVSGIVGVGDELDRARAVVARGRGQRDRLLARARSRSSAETTGDGDSSSTFWWRRCSEHSRSPSEMHVAVRVADHLHLDVPRARQEALDEHAVVAEARPPPRAARRRSPRRAPSGASTTRIPRPPPPAAALTSSG